MRGLPDTITTCLFDLDGVLTDTARIHRAAWGRTFYPVLQQHGQEGFSEQDYNDHVDGKPRIDGVRDFFASRHIQLSDDEIAEIADRKNREVLTLIDSEGVEVFPDAFNFISEAAHAGLRRIVVSSSANTTAVLQATGLADIIENQIDGAIAQQQHLHGKPAPDTFLAGAELAGVEPSAAAVFEDATAGVEAGHRGHFGFVVGVNRLDDEHGAALSAHGADTVVHNLDELQ